MDAIELARHSADRMAAHDEALRALGIEIDIPAPGEAIARMEVTAAMINGFGICHGGYVFTLADTAFAFACNAYGQVTVAAGASIDFLRPVYAGDRLEASACEQHRGRRHGIYDVVVRNQDGRRVAVFRGRAQTTDRPLPGEAGPAGNDTNRIENPEKT